MRKIIIEDIAFINELEKLQNEVYSSQALLAYIINSSQSIVNYDNFNYYEQKYQKSFAAYKKKKRELEKNIFYQFLSHKIKNGN